MYDNLATIADNFWHLGIDLGTTELRATLVAFPKTARDNPPQEYPLHWLASDSAEGQHAAIPAVARLNLKAKQGESSPLSNISVGTAALSAAQQQKDGILLDRFKPYLDAAIPYYAQGKPRWEPQLQVYGSSPVPLYWLQLALQNLLAALNPQSPSSSHLRAEGVSEEALNAILSRLEGVAIGCPVGWSDAYRFNLREAILGAGLVRESSRIFFLEEAIAAMLGRGIWREMEGRSVCQLPARGMTLVVHGGATQTELALVDLRENPEELTHEDFGMWHFPYGGNALIQDIFYQLIYPQWLPHQSFLEDLEIEIPEPGEPDRPARDRAYFQIQAFPGGKRLLETAERVWRILQKQESFRTKLGEQEWGVERKDLEQQAIYPYIRQLNAQLNALLSQRGMTADAIVNVLCSGKTAIAIRPAIKAWLAQKLVNAKVIETQDNPTSSLVALGLGRLPAFPQLLDALHHQYSDYFLLRELLHVLPNHSFRIEEILQRLEKRGINTRTCRDRLLAFLKGYLPSGLVPTTDNAGWLTVDSQYNRDYQGITVAPLFSQDPPGCYRANHKQCQRLRQYFTAIAAGTQQKLEEPLSLPLL
ncbi:hypothetical protein IQ249_15895 [Lusitaniella coriacea LEGE 07157]|uniref:Uncharacterized protein n=1 Tax=Lusitaniella coriacea LEGE 07157 TaxID=945747 RepID=A0A8J7DXR2_9CYAN|nr:hypothetical protein [Lusitaniella coriacea]MBE9117382.1 hypothetical protein [Lusitaniella coriacea LEGE 07157]